MAFAEVSDIETRWRTLDSDEANRAEALINDASAILSGLVAVDEDDDIQAELLTMVCCNMVIRVLRAAEAEAYDATQMSVTAGPYTQSWTYSSMSGRLRIERDEKRWLGITSSYIGAIEPAINGYYGSNGDDDD